MSKSDRTWAILTQMVGAYGTAVHGVYYSTYGVTLSQFNHLLRFQSGVLSHDAYDSYTVKNPLRKEFYKLDMDDLPDWLK